MKALGVAAAVVGWALLGVLALAGVALSALVAYASSPAGRPVVARALVRLASARVAGRLELGAVVLTPGGAISIRNFEAYDPEGRLVLQVDRLVLAADLTRLRNKVIGLDVELYGPDVLVDEDAEGRLSLVRAFEPAHPAPPSARKPPSPSPWRDPAAGWTFRLRRLAVRDASVWWQDAAGRTRVDAQDLNIDGRAIVGPGRTRAELMLRGDAVAPVPGPLALDLRVLVDGDAVRVPIVRAQVGGTELTGMGQGDLAARTGRAALTRAVVDRAQARSVLKDAPAGADLSLDAYAEADGRVATAAVRIEPRGGGAAGAAAGGGEAAVAVPLDGTRALGFDLVTRALDPSALAAVAPPGDVTLAAHGGFSGRWFAEARGNLDLSLAPSRLRDGELGPASAQVRLDRGDWDVTRLSLVAPGVRVEGAGAYGQRGVATGRFTAAVDDLARASRNAGKLLGRPLPSMAGRAQVDASLSGTAAAPAISAELASPALSVGGTSASAIEARIRASGPFRPGQLEVQARLGRLGQGQRVLAQGVSLAAGLAPVPGQPGATAATLSASGLVPSLGKEAVSVEGEGLLPAGARSLRLSRLALVYPGSRWALEAPATVQLQGPRVDRLALADGPRRIALEGGVGPRRTLDARLEVVELDLARLPAGLLPAEERIAGVVSGDARATGTVARPQVEARLQVAEGGFRTERDVGVKATLRYDGEARRAVARLDVSRAGGGTAAVDADVPVPFKGRPAEPVAATLRVDAFPIPALLDLAGVAQPVAGRLSVDARLSGKAGAPALEARVAVADGVFRDLEGVGLDATASVAGGADLSGEVRLDGRPAVRLQARAPLSLAALLAEPRRTLDRLRQARLTADGAVPGLELAALSGRLGVPAGLRGRLAGEVHAAGSLLAPRGTATLEVSDAAYGGYTGISGRVEAAAGDDRVEARGAAQLQGRELVRLTAALRAPLERLETRAGLEAAPLVVDGTVPGVDLERAAPAGVALSGVIEATLHAEGTLGRPVVRLDGSGRSVQFQGRPVGQVRVAIRAGGERATAEVGLDPPAGGKLIGTLLVRAPISLGLGQAVLRAAPAELTVRADAVDLGFAPALLPTVIRSAAGKLDADVSARGPLAELAPRGTVRLTGGRLGFLDYGEYTGMALDASVGEDAVELRTLEAHRGEGTLLAHAALRGLASGTGRLDGRVDTSKLTFSRAGTDLATVTVGVKLSGTYRDRKLDVRLDVPEGLVRLADKLPRDLQSLERRPDIVVGPRPPPKKSQEPQPAGPAQPGRSFTLVARVVAPGKFNVQRESPRVRVELKADATYEHQAGGDFMTGSVEVVRGTVEPLTDRRFEVKRARLTFTGGPPSAANIDAEAVWPSPANVTVTVTVVGPVTRPTITLKSQPPLDEGQIAMLIATGQTELSASGGQGGAAQGDLARSAAQKLGFAVFNTFIRDQLPFGTGDVSLDTSAAKVSGYIPGTKVYVGFTRRFDANRQLGENEEEVRMEYAITPHWTLEGRWGNANTGGASLIWSKDY